MPEQRREYFRLEYPETYRPTLQSRNEDYEVVDLSEFGVKFKVNDIEPFLLGDEVAANIRFHDDEYFECRGKVIRFGQAEVVINLSDPLPLQKIRSEHIYLINKYSSKYN